MEEEGAEGNRENFDLLHKFMKTRSGYYPNEEDEEIELSLGLSMNGIFGVDPTRNKKLKRSFSSIPNLFGGGVGIGTAAHHAPLGRTLSLPTETEEECRRRRKDLQSMRRMEARKKRMEKLKNLRVLKDNKESFSHDVGNGNFNGQRIGNGIFRRFENGGDVIESSQGSIGPLRSACSSASSDLIEGPKQSAEVSPSSHQSSHEYEPGVGQAVDKDAAGGELLKNHAMLDMPYVTTKENGPNGRKIQGYLYRYKKGEEVRIVCVCHGMFLTPKEFVEHGGCTGGGEEVEHPLKHIVVNPFPLL